VNLATPESVRKLQRALYAKAKADPAYCFYTLYDKIYRKDVLQEAWSRCRANDGSSGVDGQSFEGIERKGVERWLEELAQELRTKTYRPQAVRRVYIPKADGKKRPNKRRTTVNKDCGKGTPQGAPISPLLANLYMRRFLLGWKQQGWEQRLQAYIVNYADDFVILCRRKAAEAQAQMAKMTEKLRLEVNQQKTRTCRVPEESFDFLGYTLGRCYRVKTGQAYIGTKPSKKRVLKFCESISQKTQRETCGRDTEEVIGELNLMLKGWANYFRLGSVSKAYESVDSHVRNRLRQWLGRKHKIKGRVENHFPDEYLYEKLGVIRLTHFHTNLPWAKAK